MPSLLQRVAGYFVRQKAAVPVTTWNQVFSDSSYLFQRDIRNSSDALASSAVYACVSVIANDIAKLPVQHWRKRGGAKDPVNDSAAARLLRRPNHYQTWPNFVLDLVRALLLQGNAYSVASRNGRTEVYELHPMTSATPMVSEDGSVFYSVSASYLAGMQKAQIPSRDVLHVRALTLGHPLIGITPISAAAAAGNGGMAIAEKIAEFSRNMTRPGGTISFKEQIDPAVMGKVGELFDAAYKAGKTAALGSGGEFKPLAMTAVDMEMVELLKWTAQDVAMVFGVPAYRLGLGNLPAGSAESVNRTYVTGTLSFYLRLIETALESLLEIPNDEAIEFDLDALLRADLAARMDAYAKGVQGGVLTPNEARAKEWLASVPGGENAFIQRQCVPLSLSIDLAEAEIATKEQTDTQPGPDAPDTATDDVAVDEKALRESVRLKLAA
jgi:HK97 family phage portal protein